MHKHPRSHDARKLKKRISQSLAPDQQEAGQTLRQIEQCLAQSPPEIAKTQISEYSFLSLPEAPKKVGIAVPAETAEALAKEKASLIKIDDKIYFVGAITKNQAGQDVLVCAESAKWERDRTGRGTSFHHGEAGNYYAKVFCEQVEDDFFYKIKVYSRKKNKDVFKQVANEGWESTLSRALFEADNMIACCRAADHKKKKPGKKVE